MKRTVIISLIAALVATLALATHSTVRADDALGQAQNAAQGAPSQHDFGSPGQTNDQFNGH